MSNELVSITEYKKEWPLWFQEEHSVLQKNLNIDLVVKIEHFGSTAVPGCCAKPVIDILVGLKEFTISDSELKILEAMGYKFIERSTFCERFYFKKRGERNFNLSLVLFSGDVWEKCINARDFLRANPDKVLEYSNIKKEALATGHTTIAEYSKYKYSFVCKLCQDAAKWKRISP